MSELETPDLQIKRYVDLLKRRRWQILPVALLGLFIGAVVARLIPRFYEASTQIRIHKVMEDDSRSRARKDPLLREVSDARNTILAWDLVRETVLQLGDWEDFFAVRDDDDKFNAKLRSVQDRIWVSDLDPGDGRGSATLRIGYRDQDAKRTVEFVDRITRLYIKRRTDFVEKRELNLANLLQRRADVWKASWDQALGEMARFIEEHRFNPTERNLQGISLQGQKIKRHQSLTDRVRDLEIDLGAYKQEISSIKAKIEDGTIPKVMRVELDFNDPAVKQLLLPLLQERERLEIRYEKYSEIHPGKRKAKAQILEIDKLIEGKRKEFESMGKTEKPHPEYLAANLRIRELNRMIDKVKGQLALLSPELEKLDKELSLLPALQARYAKLQQRVEESRKAYDAANLAVNGQLDRLESVRVNSDQVVELLQPPYRPLEPTYPNKPLVAMLGLLIAALVAGTLIVLLDFLQSSFKTIEEVRRSLPVPVLGGISYLELAEEIETSRRTRIKVTIIALVTFVLIGSLLAVYFLDPVRLPVWVVNLLDGLIGS